MKRVTVAARRGDTDRVIEALQESSSLHLEPSRVVSDLGDGEPQVRRVREAIRYLQGARSRRRPLRDPSPLDATKITATVLENRRRRIALQAEIDALGHRIQEVEPWGDFEFPPLEQLAGYRLWFYVVSRRKADAIQLSDAFVETVSSDVRNRYLVVLSRDEPPIDSMPVKRSRIGTRSLSTLRFELDRHLAMMDELDDERVSLTRWLDHLRAYVGRSDDAAERARTKASGVTYESVFALEGWVPAPAIDDVCRRLNDVGGAIVIREPAPDEEPPVLLKNMSTLSPGEDLLGFYQLPGYRDWDPSAFVYFSFVVFFAMIIADAGYSALLAVGLLLFWRRLSSSAASRRLRQLVLSIACAGAVYGVLAGSYFGLNPDPGGWLGALSVIDATDAEFMMPLSLGVGVLHLVVANLASAWRRGLRSTSVAAAGWVMVLISGFLIYRGVSFAQWGIVVGLSAVFLFSSDRSGLGVGDLGRRAIDGATALTGVTRAFGDALSYLRLFALGLASASLAVTFNSLAGDLYRGAPLGVGLLAAILVLVIGHSLNFVLAIVGGVVHGLRLNVIELYNWGVFGEGRPFSPLSQRSSLDQ
ncbi:MAG: V-type ATP synthase subunit I [Myxococcota bacterium]